MTKSEYYFQLAIHLYPWEFYTKIKKKKKEMVTQRPLVSFFEVISLFICYCALENNRIL